MAMKLLCVVGAATAVAASSSSVETASSSLSSSIRSARTLQDASGASYAYINDLSGRQLQYSNCVRVKVPQEYDDDAAEGNVNFYNGRYHAQYQIFATFHVCGDGSGNGDQCYDCDFGTEYASEAGEYLQTTLEFYEQYCEECANACGAGRRLEDEANAAVNCNTCSNECATYYKGNDDGVDESNYIECAAGYVDDDGLQLYYGPQCSDDGSLVVGVFYDDECTIKTKHDAPDFDYYKFGAVTSGCLDCSNDQGGEACGDLYGEAYHCFNGADKNGGGDGNMNVCSAVKKATTTIDYSGVKKRHRGADMFLKTFLVLSIVGLMGGFFFLTYTYFIRHRGEKNTPMLSDEDVHEDEVASPGGTLT